MSEKEGLLYKKLQKELQVTLIQGKFLDIDKVLDEAKQDFPKGNYFQPDVNKIEKLAQILTWKEKWFGE